MPNSKEPAANTEEPSNDFVNMVRQLSQYWSTQKGTDLEKCDGLAFSILNLIDEGGLEIGDTPLHEIYYTDKKS